MQDSESGYPWFFHKSLFFSCEYVGFEIGHQCVPIFFSVSCDGYINLTITSNCRQTRRGQWWCTRSKRWCTTGSICFGWGHKYVLNGISCFFLIDMPSSMFRGVLSSPLQKRRILGNSSIEWSHYLKLKRNIAVEHILKRCVNHIYTTSIKRYHEIIKAYVMYWSICY